MYHRTNLENEKRHEGYENEECQVQWQLSGNEGKVHQTMLFPANYRQCVGNKVVCGNELEKDTTKCIQRDAVSLKSKSMLYNYGHLLIVRISRVHTSG